MALLAIALGFQGANALASPLGELLSAPWTVENRASLQRLLPDNQAVSKLLQNILPRESDESSLPKTNEYTFADLRGDGALELICTLTDGGRFFPTVLVIEKGTSGFSYSSAYDGGAMDIPDLGEVIISADDGPQKQLLLPRWLGMYPGAWPAPIIYDIYKYSDGSLRRADLIYQSYYKNVLIPKLKGELAALLAGSKASQSEANDYRSAEIAAREKALQAMVEMSKTGIVP